MKRQDKGGLVLDSGQPVARASATHSQFPSLPRPRSAMNLKSTIIARWAMRIVSCLLVFSSYARAQSSGAAPVASGAMPAKTWVDAKTGHRITRVSDVPGSKALYFNVNAFTPDGKSMVYMSPRGIHVLDLATLNSSLLVRGGVHHIVVGTRTRRAFFMKQDDQHVYVVNLDSGQVSQMGAVPADGVISTVNADETLLAGTYIEGGAANYKEWKYEAEAAGAPAAAAAVRLAANVPEDLFTMSVASAEVKDILRGTDWLNHVLFSPTDPTLIMYDHERSFSFG